MSEFKDNLKKFREERLMTQEVLAKKTGFSAEAISHYETGKRENPTLKKLLILANALNVTLDELAGRGNV